jgi:hypothetical protein
MEENQQFTPFFNYIKLYRFIIHNPFQNTSAIKEETNKQPEK